MEDCVKKTSCSRYMRLGANACLRCTPETVPERPPEAPREQCTDDYGNTGSKLYDVRLKRTTWEEQWLTVAADSVTEARERATNVDYEGICDGWEWDDEEIDADEVTENPDDGD